MQPLNLPVLNLLKQTVTVLFIPLSSNTWIRNLNDPPPQISDKAAKLIAMTIKGLLNSK